MFKNLIFLFFSIFYCYGQEISFMRFYANDHDYLSDNRLLATARFDRPYIQVFYNDNKVPIIREFIDSKGELKNKEIFEYKNEKKMIRRYFLDEEQRPDSLIQYGVDEPWSLEFRKVIKDRNKYYFEGQESKFILNASDQIQKIVFSNVQGFDYGEIKFIYDHLGLLKGELWNILPAKSIVRRFIYDVDMITGKKEIWEYGENGQEISWIYNQKKETFFGINEDINKNKHSEFLEELMKHYIDKQGLGGIPKTDFDALLALDTPWGLWEFLKDLPRVEILLHSIHYMDLIKSITSKYGERIYP